MDSREEHCRIPERSAPVWGRVDVVVVGGGFPGVCAAVGAARAGASVALVERDGMLGGQAAEIYTFGLDGFVDNGGRQFVRGIPWEIMTRTFAEGQSDPMWTGVDYGRMEQEGVEAEMRRFGMSASPTKSQTYVNPNAFRYVLQTLADQEGITTFLECPLVGALAEGRRLRGIVAQGHYGPFAINGQVIVDTTPHAAVAALADHPFPYPQVYTGTHPRVAGVAVQRLLDYAGDNPGEVEVSSALSGETASLKELVDQGMALLMAGFTRARQRALADDPAYEITGRGDPPQLVFFYDRDGCGTYWIHADEWRRTRLDDPLHLSRTVAELRKRQWLTHKLFREYVPGFAQASLMDVHPHIARALLRSRDPGGFTEHDIPWEHIEEGGQRYGDSVARVMGHPDAGQAAAGFQVPYRSLIPKGLEGLLVTGKPACRFFHYHGTHAALGQAAGVAAAIGARDRTPLRTLSVARVQEELRRQGAVVS
jgi:hypothetical protein